MLIHNINRISERLTIDGEWNKPGWKHMDSITILNENGWKSDFSPITKVKLCYDENNLYIIYRVEDKYIYCNTRDFNGPVWEDSCVEFFFSPNPDASNNYFNLEINCCGTVLMAYQRIPGKDFTLIEIEDLQKIEIAHSLPKLITEEIEEATTWTVEYRLPLHILQKYANIVTPDKGVTWKSNFYKCVENNSHPHWLSWAKINSPEPDFHLPQYFGTLRFL